MPVTADAPVPSIERPTLAIGPAAMGAIEINLGNTHARIQDSHNEATLLPVLRMLRVTPELAA